MKLADRTVETHSVGVRSNNQFSIAQTSKMFKILSDSLYSDKVMAVIRELATNAHDAHVAAGNQNPFKVTLPTQANPVFIVRDYGTGLSQADMEELYTTYGASNKNTSNDFVGCLGLGSKSPFAYTKSFTTSSYFNGTKYTYVAAIDETGVPTLNLLDVTPTDQPNGLEISFAVKQYDFTEFSQKAARVFHYFKMKPIIEGGYGVDFKKKYSNTNIVISGNGWRVCLFNNNNDVFPNGYNRINSGVVAIMGNIAYPVDVDNIIPQEKNEVSDNIQRWNRTFGKADIDNWKNFVKEIINANLYLELDFGIGELEMDVSREGLQYTKSVIKTLRDKTQEIYLEMKEEFSKKIATAKTLVEATTLYYQMNDLAGGWGVGASWTDSNGKKHDISSGKDLEYKLKSGKSLYVINYRTAGYRSRRMIYATDRIHHDTLTGKGQYYWNNSKKTHPIGFFFCDMKGEETAKKIAVKYCNQNNCFAYLLVDTNDHTKCTEGFDQLIEDVGVENFKNISDYKSLTQHTGPRKTGNRSSHGVVSDQDVFFINGGDESNKISNPYNDAHYLRTLDEDDLEEFMESEDIVYIPILRYGSTGDSPEIHSLYRFINDDTSKSLAKKVIGDTPIYAIKNSFVEKLKNKGLNLIEFNSFLESSLENIMDDLNAASNFSGIVNFCKDQLDRQQRGYTTGNPIDEQFLWHMINIFGLDYEKYIKNTKLVDCLDNLMTINFFASDVHNTQFRFKKFTQSQYSDHMNKLLKKIGIDSYDSSKIKSATTQLNALSTWISYLYKDHETVLQKFSSLVKPNTSKDSSKLPKLSEIKEIVKAEVDKNPMLKYILGSHENSGNLTDLGNSNNPLAPFASRGYYSRTNDWIYKMSDDSALLFKTQLSSLIG